MMSCWMDGWIITEGDVEKGEVSAGMKLRELSSTSCQMLKATEHLRGLITLKLYQMTQELENLIKMHPNEQAGNEAGPA